MTATALALTDRTLAQLEAEIEEGLRSFLRVGLILAEIRERRLYKETHDTFDAYCQERWDFNRQRASQIIKAASVSKILDIKPKRASHATALVPIVDQPEVARAAYAQAEAATAGKVTQAAVETAVSSRVSAPKPSPRHAPDPDISQDVPADDGCADVLGDDYDVNNEAPDRPRQPGALCGRCDQRFTGTVCPCTVAATDPHANDTEQQEEASESAAPATASTAGPTTSEHQSASSMLGGRRSAISTPTTTRRDSEGHTYLAIADAPEPLVRTLTNHAPGAAARAFGEEATLEWRLAMIGLMVEQTPWERIRPLVHRLKVRERTEGGDSTASIATIQADVARLGSERRAALVDLLVADLDETDTARLRSRLAVQVPAPPAPATLTIPQIAAMVREAAPESSRRMAVIGALRDELDDVTHLRALERSFAARADLLELRAKTPAGAR